MYSTFRQFSRNCSNIIKNVNRLAHNEAKKADLEKRRAQMMAKGLPKLKPIPNVKDIILVSSGKGGVGKSTTAVNLAAAMKVEFPEKNVGLLDADVFGPSVPLMMNLDDTPILNDKNLMEPLVNYGVKCMSMGFLMSENAALIWRGLMVMQALERLMRQVEWGPTDYLIVDTPPGTGDTHLTLLQNLPITGAILVTTPQSASIQVTRRGGVMFEKMKIPIIGIVENMSSIKCPACRSNIQLFGNGVDDLAEEFETQILQHIPLEKEINSSSDKGVPIIIGKPNCNEAIVYKKLAQQVKEFVENKPK
ncbi:PREDICTED: iron-sulfur protein NUBPL [Nicrophorus vespilloides]|uniref:Iron-sulfur protein NUBPL n=1 Tax=Nicrophorus vespilloides TaxID=110193 RepID=A0ABM1MRW8_NICVS|nr:PREDICTED: iron-sulfur protein NUBPL [Nicrophorus vespilloides]